MMPPRWRCSLAYGFFGICDAVWSTFLILFGAGLSQAFAFEFDAVSIVNEAIEHSVGIGGIGNDFMPTVHGQLGSDDGRMTTISLFEDFKQIVTSGGVERLQPPIIEDQKISAAQRAYDARVTTIAARQSELLEELWNAMIDYGSIIAAGFVPER